MGRVRPPRTRQASTSRSAPMRVPDCNLPGLAVARPVKERFGHHFFRRIFLARAYTLLVVDAGHAREETQARHMKRPYESLQKRDAAAWDEFYEEHARELYGFVFRLVRGDPQTAADVFQDTWLDAISHIGQFDPQRGELQFMAVRNRPTEGCPALEATAGAERHGHSSRRGNAR